MKPATSLPNPAASVQNTSNAPTTPNTQGSLPPGSPRALLQRNPTDAPRVTTPRKSSEPVSPRVRFGSVVRYQATDAIDGQIVTGSGVVAVRPLTLKLKATIPVSDPVSVAGVHPAPATNSPRRMPPASTTVSPREPYPYPELSRFAGTKDQFRALGEDYKGLATFFGTDNLKKQKRDLAKLLKHDPACDAAQALCLKIEKQVRSASRTFRKHDFREAQAAAQTAKELDIALNTLFINSRSEGRIFDVQNFWQSAREALIPCTAALSKLIILCDEAVSHREFKPGTPRSRGPDGADPASGRKPVTPRGSQTRTASGATALTPRGSATATTEMQVQKVQAGIIQTENVQAEKVKAEIQSTEPQFVVFGPPPPASAPPLPPSRPLQSPEALEAVEAVGVLEVLEPPDAPDSPEAPEPPAAPRPQAQALPLSRRLFADDDAHGWKDDPAGGIGIVQPPSPGGGQKRVAPPLFPERRKLRRTVKNDSPGSAREEISQERIAQVVSVLAAEETGQQQSGLVVSDSSREPGADSPDLGAILNLPTTITGSGADVQLERMDEGVKKED